MRESALEQRKSSFHVNGIDLQYFDILSTKEKQFGFRTLLPNAAVLVCLGDEPYNEGNHCYAGNTDWLLCEAYDRQTEGQERGLPTGYCFLV